MPYWDLIARSFRIAWQRPYLWLIAFFAGEGGSGASFNFNYSQRLTGGSSPDVNAAAQRVLDWISSHVTLLLTLGAIYLAIAIAFFILAAICEGATVRAAAEHDAERPFGLAWAWTSGVGTMWVIVRIRLIVLVLGLPLALLLVAWFVGILVALLHSDAGMALLLVAAGLLLALVGIPYSVYLSFLDRFGVRAAVLEQVKAIAALRRANQLLVKRLGRSLLVWLISIVVSVVVGIAIGSVVALATIPFVIGFGLSYASGSGGFWPLVAGLVLLIPLVLIVSGFVAAQSSTYWTLAFRRLDLEYATP